MKNSALLFYALLVAASPMAQANLVNLNLDMLSTGNHTITADGETFTGYVRNDAGTGWLLIGRGRNGWEFDTDGQGAVSDVGVAANLGTSNAFAPALYRDAIINDLITNSGIDLTDVEIRLRRASDVNGVNPYQEVLWRPVSQTTWTGDLQLGAAATSTTSGFDVVQEIVSGLGTPAAIVQGKTADTWNTSGAGSSLIGNNAQRVFTWSWGPHGGQRGFSYGQTVQGVDNNSPTSFLWESGTENHAIPYTEVYIRSLVAVVPEPSAATLLLLAGPFLLRVARRRVHRVSGRRA